MDVLNPSKCWVGNRCYRVLTHQVEESRYNYREEEDTYSEENVYNDEAECGAGGGHEYNIEQVAGGKYRTAWPVPSAYYSYLIGAKGATKKRLEQESGCTITIPSRGQSGDIVVTGVSVPKVRTGRLRVEMLVEQARRKQTPTHFLSVPANEQQLQQNFIQFKARVMGVCGQSRGVSEQLFQEPGRLHLTVGVMALMDDSERRAAVLALTQAIKDSPRFSDGCLRLRVKGLHYFNDDPGEVSVLYAGIQPSTGGLVGGGDSASEGGASPAGGGAWCAEGGESSADPPPSGGDDWSEEEKKDVGPEQFQEFVDHLMNAMVKAGLMRNESEKVRLHVTLLNTSFLLRDRAEDPAEGTATPASSSRSSPSKRFKKETFDARDIIKNFGDFDFGELEVRCVHLSVMHSRDPRTGYYSATTVVPLPGQKQEQEEQQ